MQVAAIYRVSTEKQVKRDGEESIPLQAEAVRSFLASRPGWNLVREYAEEGVSGFRISAGDRDVLQQALADARRGLFSALIVFKADRLSRNALEYPLVIDQFRRLGCEVWSVADAPGGKLLALDTQMDKFVRFLEGWQAETESQNTSIRVSEAMRQMAREGRWTGGPPPFGYRLNPLRRPRSSLPALLIDEAAAEIVKRMVELCLRDRLGCGRIAAVLNQDGPVQPPAKPWNAQRVRRILQNPIIAGLPAYGRTHGNQAREPGQRSAGRRGESPYDLDRFLLPRDDAGNLRPVHELQIVPLEQWLQVMASLRRPRADGSSGADESGAAACPDSRRPRKPGATASPGPDQAGTAPSLRPARGILTGLLTCGHCGAKLVASTGSGGRRYYVCRTHLNQAAAPPHTLSHNANCAPAARTCDGQRTYGARRLERAVLAQMQYLLSMADPAALQSAIREVRAAGATEADRRRQALSQALTRAERALQGWLDRLEAVLANEPSLLTEEVLTQRIAAAQVKRDQLYRLLAAEPALEPDPPVELSEGWWRGFANASLSEQRLMLQELVDQVIVRKDRLELRFSIDLRILVG